MSCRPATGARGVTGFSARRGDSGLRGTAGGRVHHRGAKVALRGLLPLARRRLDEPGLDPELAHPQPLVGLERDFRAGEQREILARGVLEKVRRRARRAGRARSPRTAGGPRARGRRCTRSGRRCARRTPSCSESISFASLRASSTGCTRAWKARLNTPSTRPSSLASRLRQDAHRRSMRRLAARRGPGALRNATRPRGPSCLLRDRSQDWPAGARASGQTARSARHTCRASDRASRSDLLVLFGRPAATAASACDAASAEADADGACPAARSRPGRATSRR